MPFLKESTEVVSLHLWFYYIYLLLCSLKLNLESKTKPKYFWLGTDWTLSQLKTNN